MLKYTYLQHETFKVELISVYKVGTNLSTSAKYLSVLPSQLNSDITGNYDLMKPNG